MASVTSSSLEDSVDATLSILRAEAPQRRAQPFTIFRVPAYVREANRSAYEPRMVSIGPYYHGAAALCAMEDHKWRYLHDLMSRSGAVSSSVMIQEMRSLKPRARACYSERPLLGSDDFVRMLLLDGCFILEFFFKWHTREPDALCDVGWGLVLVTADLLLLENQIPFFVVERLYDVVAGGARGGGRENLINLLVEYIGCGDEVPIAQPSDNTEIHHLLHLYYESFVPKRRSPPEEHAVTVFWEKTVLMPPASELSNLGVTFVPRASPRDKFDFAFHGSRGVMEIPFLEIDDMKAPLLGKLMAFEQSQSGGNARVLTGYVWLMSMLVRTADDVALLRRSGIWSSERTNVEMALFFSQLGHGAAIMNYDDWLFAGLCREVARYSSSWRRRNWAALKCTELITIYFRSPWSIISVVAAALHSSHGCADVLRRVS